MMRALLAEDVGLIGGGIVASVILAIGVTFNRLLGGTGRLNRQITELAGEQLKSASEAASTAIAQVSTLQAALETLRTRHDAEIAELRGALKICNAERKVQSRKIEALVEGSPDPIVTVNRAGSIVAANVALQRETGWVAQDLIGRPVSVLVPEDVAVAHAGHVTAYLRSPVPRPMGADQRRLRLRRKDGTEAATTISLTPIDEGLVMATLRIDAA